MILSNILKFHCSVQILKVRQTTDPPKGHVKLPGSCFFIMSISNDDESTILSILIGQLLKDYLMTNFSCTVNVFDRKEFCQLVKEYFSDGQNEWTGSYNDVCTLSSVFVKIWTD